MKSITENLALFSVLAVMLSVIEFNAYYAVFGIKILPYMEFSEVIQLNFFSLLMTFASFIVVMTAMLLFSAEKTLYLMLTPLPDTASMRARLGTFMVPLIMVACLASGSYYNGWQRAQEVLQGRSVTQLVLVGDAGTIRTDSTVCYVGTTRNYFVLYDRTYRHAKLLKADRFHEIRYGNP